MAGSKKYTALLDANVLFSSVLTDLFIRLHLQGIVCVRWSETILNELKTSLQKERPTVNTASRIEKMNNAVADACVTGYQRLVPCIELGNDKDDHHVFAAAITGHCDTIVTFNLKDFPLPVLNEYAISAIHPDNFLYDQLTLDSPKALAVLKDMLGAWKGEGRFDRLITNLTKLDMLKSTEWIDEYRGVLDL